MLADLLNVPKSQTDWALWTFSNKEEIARIRLAIASQKSMNLTEYQLDPINFDHVEDYLENNQNAHTDFNQALGLSGSDLEEVDIKDEQQLSEWIFLNYQEIYSAQQALGI